jgi:hypothetical protein
MAPFQSFNKENAMLQQIIVHTPLWVWAILAFLLYRGLLASVDREVALRRVFLIPLIMLVLSLQGMVSAFGADSMALPVWLACTLAATALAWQGVDAGSVRPQPQRAAVLLRGSWMPLALMMGVFCTKYAVGVAMAMQPALKLQATFAVGICALYGVFNGIFIGRALRTVAIYRQAALPAADTRVA